MKERTPHWHSLQIGWLGRQFARGTELPFGEILSAEAARQMVGQAGEFLRERIFAPLTTLWVFLAQASSADGTCRHR